MEGEQRLVRRARKRADDRFMDLHSMGDGIYDG